MPILTAFVNSAPPAFTSFGFTCGGGILNSQFDGYTKYVADVIRHFKDDEGIEFTHVSPMNEPDSVSSSLNFVNVKLISKLAIWSSAEL